MAMLTDVPSNNPPEVYLPDERVIPIQEALYREIPQLTDWRTDFVTMRFEPPWYGVLPEGEQGISMKPILQFALISDYPPTRKIQRASGLRHSTRATLYEDAWEEAEKERQNGHYVNGSIGDPLEKIFRGLMAKHKWEVTRLSTIMN
jgi:hypothetical protein